MRCALFHMSDNKREKIISNHIFYVEQAKKRLLSQFDNIETEANELGEEKLKEYAAYYAPDFDNACQLMEAAYNERGNYYHMLYEMKNRTLLSVIGGMLYEWEKNLRDFIAEGINNCFGEKPHLNKEIYKKNVIDLLKMFDNLGFITTKKEYHTSLHKYKLLINAYKHGNGESFDKIKEEYPEFIYLQHKFFELKDATHEDIKIKDAHIKEFSESIICFWKDVPDYIYYDHSTEIPTWFQKAYYKDD